MNVFDVFSVVSHTAVTLEKRVEGVCLNMICICSCCAPKLTLDQQQLDDGGAKVLLILLLVLTCPTSA